MKKQLFSLVALLLCAAMAMAENCLVFVQMSGADIATATSEIGTLKFIGDDAVLFDESGIELGRTPLDQIQKIVFTDVTPTPMSINNTETEVSVRIYPNPTADMLVIDGAGERQTIRIYSMDGRFINAAQVQDGKAVISVSTLSRDNYLLQVGAEVVKFIKK